MDKQTHWEQVYKTKSLHEVSWYQPKPETSLSLIHQWSVDKDAAIIDSKKVDGASGSAITTEQVAPFWTSLELEQNQYDSCDGEGDLLSLLLLSLKLLIKNVYLSPLAVSKEK